MILEIVLVLSALPLGFFLAWLTRDELVLGRRWFKRLVIVSLALGAGMGLYGLREGMVLGVFLAILSYSAYHQSFIRRGNKSKV
jgi:ABC-type Fe3+ transport system permease subunit